MPLTAEQRAEINRQNARKSTGPKTEAGKARSRRNALKHGLAGSGVVLSVRDERKFQTKLKEMSEHLQPVDPLERILVRRIALAGMRLEKCERKTLADEARHETKVLALWEARQLERVARAARGLAKRPALAHEALRSTSFGCDWLGHQWQVLAQALASPGAWTRDDALHALRLLGHDPQAALDDGAAVTLWHHAQALRSESNEARDAARQALAAFLTAEQARLAQRRARLWTEQDEPAARAALDRAGVSLSDQAARLHRYETASELSLHRNLNQLIRLRKIEPEHQSIERWHKTGKLKPRRWNGISYEPTNPYYSSSVADDPEYAPVCDGPNDHPPAEIDAASTPPAVGEPAQALPPAPEARNEAGPSASTSAGACTSDAAPEALEPALPLVEDSPWRGAVPLDTWPDPAPEPLAEAVA